MSAIKFKVGDVIADKHGTIGRILDIRPFDTFPYRVRELDGGTASHRPSPTLRRGTGEIRLKRCDCPQCALTGRHFWLVTPREGLLPIVLLSFGDAIRTADSYARRKAAA